MNVLLASSWWQSTNATIGAGVLGLAVGYFVRAAEFRRQERLKVYGEFLEAFDVYLRAHQRVGLARERLTSGQPADQSNEEAWKQAQEPMHDYFRAAGRLRLISGRRTDHVAAEMHSWITSDSGGWSLRNLTGQTAIDKATEGGVLFNKFIAVARSDLVGWPIRVRDWTVSLIVGISRSIKGRADG